MERPHQGLVVADKYRIRDHIGSGGMSDVFRAQHVLTGRTVALKLLNSDRAGDHELVRRFFAEAQTIARIDHPGLVDVLDAGHGETGPYLALELLTGVSAAEHLERVGTLDLEATIATALPVLEALQAAHEAEVIHRDLKPNNIFYCVDRRRGIRVKLLDFGIAKDAHSQDHTSTGVVLGTPDYLSPEQARGETVLDPRSDIFAMGVVLYELLTGHRPFQAPTAVATAYRITHAQAPTLAERGGPTHATLDAILQRAMAKHPAERFASAAEFAVELWSIVDDAGRLSTALADSLGTTVQLRTIAPPRLRRSTFPQAIDENANGPRIRADQGGSTRVSLDYTALTSEDRQPTPISTRLMTNRGRCRGAIARALDRHISAQLGASVWERSVKRAPRAREILREGNLQRIVLYDLAGLNELLETTQTLLGNGPPTWARQAGQDAAQGELARELSFALKPDTSLNMCKRTAVLLARLFDFGSWDVEQGDQRITVRGTQLEPFGVALRWWVAGLFQGVLNTCRPPQSVEIIRGASGHTHSLMLAVSAR